jgi:hypothetical protein
VQRYVKDPTKLAAVNVDAFKPKPTTTAGRLIKAGLYESNPVDDP